MTRRLFETYVVACVACVVLLTIAAMAWALGVEILGFLPWTLAASLALAAVFYCMLRLSAGREIRPGDICETSRGRVVTVEFIQSSDYVGIRDQGKLRIVGLLSLRRLL